LIGNYLLGLYSEANNREYQFDKSKIRYYREDNIETIKVTSKQIEYEFELLKWKLKKRDMKKFDSIKNVRNPKINGVFEKRDGDIENWEKTIPDILNHMIIYD
jgi:hypothetical protein